MAYSQFIFVPRPSTNKYGLRGLLRYLRVHQSSPIKTLYVLILQQQKILKNLLTKKLLIDYTVMVNKTTLIIK